MHREVFDTTRAVDMLRALTGNLHKPGGDVLPQPIPVRPGSVRLAWGWRDYDPRGNLNTLTEDDRRGRVTGTFTSRSFMYRLSKAQ